MRDHLHGVDEETAAIVRGMLNRGDHVHDIAAWFGIPIHVVHAIGLGVLYRSMQPAPAQALPPKGPYSSCARAYAALDGVAAAEYRLSQEAVRRSR